MKIATWLRACIAGLLTFGVTQAMAQCNYGPVMIICHKGDTFTGPTCCGWFGYCLTEDILPLQGMEGTVVQIRSDGFAVTCGAGDSAPTAGDAFTGTCGWTFSGTYCGTPYGPTPTTSDCTLYPCEGICGG